MTIELMNKNNIKKAESAAKEYCNALLPMNYVSDESIINNLDQEDKKDLMKAVQILNNISDTTKLAMLPRVIMESHISSAIITGLSNTTIDQSEQIKLNQQEINNLKAIVQQSSLVYDESEINKAKELNKVLSEQRNKNRNKNRELAREIGLRYINKL